MDAPDEFLDALSGTRFGPVTFGSGSDSDDGIFAGYLGTDVSLVVDGLTICASVDLPDGPPSSRYELVASSSSELLEIHLELPEDGGSSSDSDLSGSSSPLVARCWARSLDAGSVAAAVRAVALVASAGKARMESGSFRNEQLGSDTESLDGISPEDAPEASGLGAAANRTDRTGDVGAESASSNSPDADPRFPGKGHQAPVPSQVVSGAGSEAEALSEESSTESGSQDAGLSEDLTTAVEAISAACSESLAEGVRLLLLGEREQLMLGRHQLDELTGAVLGSVTVFNVGAGSAGGITVHAMLGSGRVADVEVVADASGLRVIPEAEGTEVIQGLELVQVALASRGRRVARIAAAGDAVIVATEPT